MLNFLENLRTEHTPGETENEWQKTEHWAKNLRTASAQIFKAKNQFVDDSIVDGPQKRSKWVNFTALRSGNLDD